MRGKPQVNSGAGVYIKILAEEAQQADAIEVARLVTQHAANLDFWVHSKRATLAALVGAGGVISLTAEIGRAHV